MVVGLVEMAAGGKIKEEDLGGKNEKGEGKREKNA